MAAHFELKQAANGQFMFNLKAGNGEIILTSGMHKAKESAESGIAAAKVSAADNARFERKTGSDGQHYFSLKAATGETIGRSEMYKSAASMENGIASVKKNGPVAATRAD